MNTQTIFLSFCVAATAVLACDETPPVEAKSHLEIENTASERTLRLAEIATWVLSYGDDRVDVEGRRPDGSVAERTALLIDGSAERQFFAPDGSLEKQVTIPRVLLAEDTSADDVCDDCYYKDLAQGDPQVTQMSEERDEDQTSFRSCTVRVEEVGAGFYCYDISCDREDPLFEFVDGCDFCGDGVPYCGN